MEHILKQIHRLETIPQFTEGEKFNIILPAITQEVQETSKQNTTMMVNHSYKIQVKKYMTEPATPSFDFQTKWNNNTPMPFVIMKGTVIKETRGMYYMEMYAEAEETTRCICCGRTLTNKISMLYGLGPECGNHAYINPFNDDQELDAYLQEVRKKISEIKWSGWVIKSAIKEWEEI